MSYPIELLPNDTYKSIECDISNHYLLRITDTNDVNKIVDPETGNVSVKYICSPGEHIVDFSTNLLGIYNEKHIYLEFTEEGQSEYMRYCQPDANVDPPELGRHYYEIENRYFWSVEICRLHQKIFKYPHGENTLDAKCIVKHTPMLWNFWHFSLHWETNLGHITKISSNAEKRTAQKIGHSARTVLSLFAKIGLPKEYAVLARNCYCGEV